MFFCEGAIIIGILSVTFISWIPGHKASFFDCTDDWQTKYLPNCEQNYVTNNDQKFKICETYSRCHGSSANYFSKY